ncbi:MAG: potassium-transporting ATPase subunit KdpC [Beijerinckiaceae bacterium]|nr:potassium-transporting ATPase subunit KdpC [Beijerinckiaceae bacterium]
MMSHIRPALVMLILFTILTGIIYPLSLTGLAGAILAREAEGSLVEVNGQRVGSSLIGQTFVSERYFHGRPSATSAPDPADATKTIDAPYNAGNSSGSNLGPIAQKLADRLKEDGEALRKAGIAGPLPADAITASASGLDPHISPAFALLQVASVAKARNLSETKVKELLDALIERPLLGLFGEPRVNVLRLNTALDRLSPA